ncbi:clostri-philic family protein [Clostridium senegalense]|nr:clostri-philic family protein [Clostridium senegalense]MBU5227893.1 hypothetical protein [Clostridium senegalense]
MSKSNKTNNSPQKGERRQRLHKNQNNRGDEKNPTEYTNFDGKPVD